MSSEFSLEVSKDWDDAVLYLRSLSERLNPAFTAELYEDGELVLDKLKGHITHQDLNWTPLSPRTIEIKGHNTIYVETGTLLNSLEVRRIKSKATGSTIIVGASPWMTHKPSGRKMSEIMGWLEYGTNRIPPRPLIRPTYEEVQDILKEHWKTLFVKEIRKGAR